MAGDNTKTLVRMANQMVQFFQSYGEEEAIAGVQNHIKKFWSPVMRRDLQKHIDHGGEGLLPVVFKAFERLAQGTGPAAKGTPDPKEQGQMASDAG